ncbi:hypothetical protein JCM10213v2_004533 [Rhodosporidiobolus nylandii]
MQPSRYDMCALDKMYAPAGGPVTLDVLGRHLAKRVSLGSTPGITRATTFVMPAVVVLKGIPLKSALPPERQVEVSRMFASDLQCDAALDNVPVPLSSLSPAGREARLLAEVLYPKARILLQVDSHSPRHLTVYVTFVPIFLALRSLQEILQPRIAEG